MEDAREVKRQSICCHVEVMHPHPMGGGRLNRCLSLICSNCSAPADSFEVVVGDMRVWPLPKGYKAPKREKKRERYPADEENPIPYNVNIPRRLYKKLVLGVI